MMIVGNFIDTADRYQLRGARRCSAGFCKALWP